jgi:mycofactocin precursor
VVSQYPEREDQNCVNPTQFGGAGNVVCEVGVATEIVWRRLAGSAVRQVCQCGPLWSAPSQLTSDMYSGQSELTRTADEPGDKSSDDLIEDMLMVEDVSIDGMCGVY